MFQAKEIESAFSAMIGVLPYVGASRYHLSESLKNSESATHWQELHSLFTLENLSETHPELETAERKIAVIPTFSLTDTYEQYQLVQQDNDLYESQQKGNLNHALNLPAYWLKTSLLDALMRRLFRSAAVSVVSSIVERKFLQGGGRSLIQRSQLFGGFGRRSDFVSTANRFVGFVFNLKHRNTAFTINHLATQFDDHIEDLPIYLYEADSMLPVKTWHVTHSRAYDMVEHAIEPFTLVTGRKSGIYRLGYYESDLDGAHAVKKTIDFNLTSGCHGCNAESFEMIKGYQPYLGVHTFYVPSAKIDEDQFTQWTAEDEISHSASESHNWGLNLGFSINCDLTSVFVEQKRAFLEAYKQQIVIQTLNLMLKTTRNNETAQNLRGLAMTYGGGDGRGSGGLYKMLLEEEKKLQTAIAAVTLDMGGIDSVCFSKKTSKSGGISLGAFS